MKRILSVLIFLSFVCIANAQLGVTLDSCRRMALRNNKQKG